MKKYFHIILLLVLAACSKTEEVGKSQLVVEGWIENGGHPVVMVSESIGIATGREMGASSILDHIAKWAKVSVSDGTKTEILTGIPDSDYFPPYIFTSSAITGEVGKTYTLNVEYKDYNVEARTTIPEPVPIDKIYVQSVTDTTAAVRVCFTDPPQKGQYYKIFTKTEGKDAHYHPSAMTNLSDESLDGYTEVFIYSTQRLMDSIDWPNIHVGDVLWIKLCSIDEKSFRYWDNFEIMLASNAFSMYFETDLESNLDGALGYWAGYGVDKEVKFTVTDPNDK
ncbi:MAG: DUF4249 domain-containing protein [Bacteroidales bacterium]|nr:DUF4249 domain-containing protein [Bacteroidales bacterium]